MWLLELLDWGLRLVGGASAAATLRDRLMKRASTAVPVAPSPTPYRARIVAQGTGNPKQDVLAVTATGGHGVNELAVVQWGDGASVLLDAIHDVAGVTKNIRFPPGQSGTTCTVQIVTGESWTLPLAG